MVQVPMVQVCRLSDMCLSRYELIKNLHILEKVSMGHGCPRLLFLFQLQLNIGYTISEQDTIYILQTQFIATLLSSLKTTKFKLRKSYKN